MGMVELGRDGVLSRESMCKGSVVFIKSMGPFRKKHSTES